MILNAKELSKSLRIRKGLDAEVLHGIDLSVAAGEMVAVVGPSGSGKSTLLHCLSGLERPTSGTVEIAGIDVASATASALARLRRGTIGFIFQEYNLLDSLTALGNVHLQTRLAGGTRSDAETAIAAVGLERKMRVRPTQLSGGEQQRVAIARALAVRPRVLFADEPTGALDSTNGSLTLQLLRGLATSRGSGVVMVTHDLEAAAAADRVVVLRDGQIRSELSSPTPEQILAKLEESTASAGDRESLT